MRIIATTLLTLAFVFLSCLQVFAGTTNSDLFTIISSSELNWVDKEEHEISRAAVEFNQLTLNQVIGGILKEFNLPLDDGSFLRISTAEVTQNTLGTWTIKGFVNGSIHNTFTLNIHDGLILGQIHNHDGYNYQLRYNPQLQSHYLYRLDPTKMDDHICDGDIEAVPENRTSQTRQTPVEPQFGTADIDVFIAYTPAARDWAQSNLGTVPLALAQSMADANLAAQNGNTQIRFNLVGARLIPYTESENISVDLRRVTISPDYNPFGSTFEETDDDGNVIATYDLEGFMDEVHDWRDDTGADLVALFTGSGGAGVAWRPSDDENGYPERGFSISRVNAAVNNLTHAHEMGHNMGNAHSRLQVGQPAGPGGGVFEYSTGWRWLGTDNNHYVSVMTYPTGQTNYPNAQRVPVFSNPDVDWQGTPSGSYTGEGFWADSTFAPPADNARSMREMRHVIASYRDPVDVVKPVIEVSTQQLHYHLFQGDTITKEVEITNTGNEVLNLLDFVHSSDRVSGISINNTQLAPGESEMLGITLNAPYTKNPGSFDFEFAILSNDWDTPSVIIDIEYDVYNFGGISFGGEGYVQVPHNLSHAVNGSQMTLQFWIKHDGNSDQDAIIISNKTSQGSDGYMARLSGTSEEPHILFAPTSFTNRHTLSNSGLKAHQWYHVTLVYNDPNTMIYINGELDKLNTPGSSRDLRNQNVGIVMGSNHAFNGNFFSGDMDEVRIWRNALTMAEINDNMGRMLEEDELDFPLAAYFWFNQTNGEIIRDMRTKNLTGTLTGDVTMDAYGAFPLPPNVYTENSDDPEVTKVYIRQPDYYTQDNLYQHVIYLTSLSGVRTEVAQRGANNTSPYLLTLPAGNDYFVEVRSKIRRATGLVEIMRDYSAPAHVSRLGNKGGRSALLDGNGYFQLPYRPSLEITGNEMSIDLWVKRLPDETGEQIIVTNKRGGNDGYELVFTSGGKDARVEFRPTSFSSRWLQSESGIPAGEWTHIAVTYLDPVTAIYINGELDAMHSAGSSRNIRGNNNDVIVGANVEFNQNFLRSAVDELRIWNRRLTMAEVQETMGDLLRGYEDNLAGYWRFDEQQPGLAYSATISSTAELIGSASVYEHGVFPVPPRVFAQNSYPDNQVELHIEPVPFTNDEPEFFQISRSNSAGATTVIETVPGNTTLFVDEDLPSDTNFFYSVKSIDSYGSNGGSYSGPVPIGRLENPMGNALRFNGNSYVDFEFHPGIDIKGYDMAVQAWVRIDESARDFMYIINNKSTGNDGFHLAALKVDDGYKIEYSVTSFGSRTIETNTILQPDQWYHITGVFSDPEVSLYVNGSLDRTVSAGSSRNIRSNPEGYTLGANHTLNDDFFTGDLDDIRIWEIPLTSEEVFLNYNTPLLGNEEGLRGYWRMDNSADGIVWPSADKILYADGVNTQFVPSSVLDDDPFRPLLLLPENGAVDQPFPLVFEWANVDNANTYTIQIAPTEAFSQVLMQQNITENLTEFGTGLKYDSTYYWRVRSHTDHFDSQWSAVWTFSMELPLPDVPDWNPSDGSQTGTDVMLAWTESMYAETYDLQVALNDDFESPETEADGLYETEYELTDLSEGLTYYWRVRAVNRTGESDWSETRSFMVTSTSVDDIADLPQDYALGQNYPNPFNPTTQIQYSLPEASHVRIDVYSINGARVATVVNGMQSAGNHNITFDAGHLASGVYIYRMQTSDFVDTKKFSLVK